MSTLQHHLHSHYCCAIPWPHCNTTNMHPHRLDLRSGDIATDSYIEDIFDSRCTWVSLLASSTLLPYDWVFFNTSDPDIEDIFDSRCMWVSVHCLLPYFLVFLPWPNWLVHQGHIWFALLVSLPIYFCIVSKCLRICFFPVHLTHTLRTSLTHAAH